MSLPCHLTLAGAVLLLIAPLALQGDDKKPTADKVGYYKDVRPIFQLHCQGCHQPAKAQGGFVMTTHADLFKKGDNDEPGVVAGQPDKSYLVEQISAHGGKRPAMPQGKDPLTESQVKLIRQWITEGALDDTPAVARGPVIDMDHPPVYHLSPVISTLAFSPNGDFLAVSGHHEVLLHKGDGTGLVARLVGESERIQSLAFSPDGKYLAASGGAPGRFGEVQVWEVEKKRLKLSLPVTFDTVYGVSWSHDGTKLAFGCADNSVRVIESATGKQILYQGGHSDWVHNTVFSTDSSHLISVSRDMSMKLTEVATQRLVDNITSITPGALKGGLQTVARRPQAKQTKVKGVDGAEHIYDEVAMGGSDGVPRLYKVHRVVQRVIGDDANRVREYQKMPGRIFALSFSKEGNYLAAGSSFNGQGEVRVYQAGDGKLVSTLQGKPGAVYAVAFHPSGKLVASAGFDGVVRLNDPNTGVLVREFVPCPLQQPATAGGKK